MKKIGVIIAGFSACLLLSPAVYAKSTQPKAAPQIPADKAEIQKSIEAFSDICAAIGSTGMKLRQDGVSQEEALQLVEVKIENAPDYDISQHREMYYLIQVMIEAAIKDAYSKPIEKTAKGKEKAVEQAAVFFKEVCTDWAYSQINEIR